MKIPRKSRIFSIPISILSLFFIGCSSTPVTQISSFGKATEVITDKVDAIMSEFNEISVERQITSLATRYKGKHADKLTVEKIDKIKPPISANDKKMFAIYKANQALREYASSLDKLAKAADKADLDNATAGVFDSLNGLNDQYEAISGKPNPSFNKDDLAGFATLIASIGSFQLEKKKKEAIKDIVVKADPNIATICDEIVKQLKTSGIATTIKLSKKNIFMAEFNDYKIQAKKGTPQKNDENSDRIIIVDNSLTLEERRERLWYLYNKRKAFKESILSVQQAQKAITAVKNAHAALKKEVEKDIFTSANIAASVKSLQDFARRYEDYQTTLADCDNLTTDDDGVYSCDD